MGHPQAQALGFGSNHDHRYSPNPKFILLAFKFRIASAPTNRKISVAMAAASPENLAQVLVLREWSF